MEAVPEAQRNQDVSGRDRSTHELAFENRILDQTQVDETLVTKPDFQDVQQHPLSLETAGTVFPRKFTDRPQVHCKILGCRFLPLIYLSHRKN